MFVITSREELRELLFSQVSNLEPELAESLTNTILEMDDEAITPLVGDADALQRLVKHFRDASLERVVALDDDEMAGLDDMNDILETTHSGSNSARWSPTPESTIQRAAIVTEREDAYFGVQRGNDIPSRSSCLTENEESPVTDDAQRQGNEEGRTERILALAGLEVTEEAVVRHFARIRDEARGFFETTRDPAQSNTMEEAVASSTNLPREETPVETVHRSGAHIPLTPKVGSVSYFGANGEPVFPVRVTSQKNDVQKSRETPRPRASRRDAADHSHPLAETQAPASMPPMQAVRPAQSPRRAPKPSRRSQPARTGAQDQDEGDCLELEAAAVSGFLCGVFLTACCILTCP